MESQLGIYFHTHISCPSSYLTTYFSTSNTSRYYHPIQSHLLSSATYQTIHQTPHFSSSPSPSHLAHTSPSHRGKKKPSLQKGRYSSRIPESHLSLRRTKSLLNEPPSSGALIFRRIPRFSPSCWRENHGRK